MTNRAGLLISGVFLVLLCGLAGAAEITTVGGLTYQDASIVDVTDTVVKFQLKSGPSVTKAICEIKQIHCDDAEAFNKAEELAAAGKCEDAAAAYQAAASKVAGAAMAKLCQVRMARAKDLAAHPDTTSSVPKTGTTLPVKTAKCPLCKGVSTTPCEECHGNGVGKCSCTKGLVTCPDCKGVWRERECYECRGSGKAYITKYFASGVQRVPYACPYCDGKGFLWFCPTCSASKNPGQVTCTTCKGTGRAGQCATCNGTKKVPCKLCHGGEVKDPSDKPADKPAAVATVTKTPDTAPAAPADPLSGLEALLKYLQTGGPIHPQKDTAAWEKLTTLQQDAAIEKYRKDLATWQASSEFKGKPITWTMTLIDVAAAPRGDGYIIKAASPKGITIPISLPASAKKNVISWKKDDKIIVTGKIDDCALNAPGAAGGDDSQGTLTVTIADASASLAAK